MHCKLPSTKIPNRSHKTSASSMECAENTKTRINRKLMRFKLSLCCYLTCAELSVGRDHIQPGGKKKKIYFIYDTYGEREREREYWWEWLPDLVLHASQHSINCFLKLDLSQYWAHPYKQPWKFSKN